MKNIIISILCVCVFVSWFSGNKSGIDKGRTQVASGEYICIKKPSKGLDYECHEALSDLFWGIESHQG